MNHWKSIAWMLAIAGTALWWISPRQFLNQKQTTMTDIALDLTPWASIGGCGAGGSGGGSNDGIQWVGQGVSGGRINLEVLPKFSVGQNYHTFTLPFRFSWKPSWNMDLAVTLPMVSKTAEVQYRSNQVPANRTTGGAGDLSTDFTLNLGPSAQYGLTLGMTWPTGQYDIVRGADAAQEFLPASLQKGGGLYVASVGLSWSRDVDDGLWIYNLTYSHPWNTAFMTGKNEFLDSWLSDYKGVHSKRFYYDWKNYGENDLGDYTPPSLSASIHYGYRGVEGMVHSFGISFSAPLGVAWIRSEKVGVYDPRPDPDHQAWSAAFVYGAEFTRDDFPIFMAISIPLHDQANTPGADEYDEAPMSHWDSPDWDDFLQQWTIALGFKTSFL